MDAIVLTYSGSAWSTDLISREVGVCHQVVIYRNPNVENEYKVTTHDILKYLAALVTASLELIIRRPYSLLRKSALLLRTLFSFSLRVFRLAGKNRLLNVESEIKKVRNLRSAYAHMWALSLEGASEWTLFLEDDAIPADGVSESLSLLEKFLATPTEFSNIELSQSYSLGELAIGEFKTTSPLGREVGIFTLRVAATNTTCASLMRRDFIEQLLIDEEPSSSDVPVDLYISLIGTRQGRTSAFADPALFIHGSDFKKVRT